MEMTEDEFAPVTPGEMLKAEFLAEYGLSQNYLAKAIGISPNRIAEIVNNRRRITADTALRLSLYFGNSPEFWMNLQTHYDLKMARRNLKPEEVEGSRRCGLLRNWDETIESAEKNQDHEKNAIKESRYR
jgi:addiction module HigA family antidote